MKKIVLILGLSALIISCNQANKHQENNESNAEETSVEANEGNTEEANSSAEFNIEDIAFSTADIGDFPFINLPKGLEARKGAIQKNFDVCFFPINGVMTPFEGKLYKANVTAVRGEEYSQRYFEKSMEDYLLSVGAVKVFDGEITKEEYERYNKQDPNKGGSGDMGYWNQNMKFYVIRSEEKGNIYIQFTSNNAGGTLNVLQEEAFQQTITKVTADDIAKDLTEKGKSILYINFDVDKANITTEGKEVVTQIAEALQNDKILKIAIEGHTDNTGDASYNKKLSNERANAVMNDLIANGIDKSRVTAKGFGAEKPLVANDSEENKARNRRVELVRTN
ncbi:OmpA family protein [Sphingobacterium composti Ten et al. 2007 non Yoo et al. 2007]|uniref:OmpA family protein n=1 Tax=Sphingobacterium composti TaxID=363260 RepID=UPI00135A3AD3|nr:OmpA family protein [Sphingobacterium composti Ten et al. 2007 non Yoo et al. 2007]